MPLLRLLPVLCLLTLSACSTAPVVAPAKVDPPPVNLVGRCPWPADLAEVATARELAAWVVEWIGAAGCERAKRQALIEAWPR